MIKLNQLISSSAKNVSVVVDRNKASPQEQTQSRWNGRAVSVKAARAVLGTGAVLLACLLSPLIIAASIPYIIANCVSNSARTKKHYQNITTSTESPSTPPKNVTDALKKQADFCAKQQEAEKDKPFVYMTPPIDGETSWDATVEEIEISGMAVGIASTQGRRDTMEDSHLAIEFNFEIKERVFPVQLFGVFDGHGGNEAANFVKEHLQQKLSEALVEFNPNGLTDEGIWKALKETMKRLESDFKNETPVSVHAVGTTATVAMILDDKLWTANVGDSRTILENAGRPQQLTEDAKPDNEHYKKGIEKRGGKVFVSTSPNHPSKVGNLSTARAIGQYEVQYPDLRGRIITGNDAKGVIPNPKITMKPLSDIALDSHLILCCDGIFDVGSTKQVVEGVHSNRELTAKEHAENIIYSAFHAKSNDNLSALVVKLKRSTDLDVVFIRGDTALHNAGFIRHILNGGDYEILEKYGNELITDYIEQKGDDYDEKTDEYVKNIKRNLSTAKTLAQIEHDYPQDVRSSDRSSLSDRYFSNLLEVDINKISISEMKYIEESILTDPSGNKVSLPDLGLVRYILDGGDFEGLLAEGDRLTASYNGDDKDLKVANILRNLQIAKLAKMETCCRRHAQDPVNYTNEQRIQDIGAIEDRFSDFKVALMEKAS